MPSSSTHGKLSATMTIVCLREIMPIRHILDIGVGEGTYRRLIGEHFKNIEFTGVEIWGPYITEYGLDKIYDRLVVGDARFVDYSMIPEADICICGDVLEHMSFDDGAALIQKIFARCKIAIVSVPAVYAPQGTHFGNQWETHIEENYNEQAMKQNLPFIIDYILDEDIGVAFMAKEEAYVNALRAATNKARQLVDQHYAESGRMHWADYNSLRERLKNVLPRVSNP